MHRKSFRYRGGTRPGFTVNLVGDGAAEAFLERIAPHVVGRDAAGPEAAGVRRAAPAGLVQQGHRAGRGPRTGWTPNAVGPASTWKDLEARSGVSVKEFLGRGSRAKRGFRRSTLQRLAGFFGSLRLAQVAAVGRVLGPRGLDRAPRRSRTPTTSRSRATTTSSPTG